MTIAVSNYTKPIAGNILKTNSVVFVFEIKENNIPVKSINIRDGKLVLLLGYDEFGNYIVFHNNKKYLYKINTNRSFSGLYTPFSIVV